MTSISVLSASGVSIDISSEGGQTLLAGHIQGLQEAAEIVRMQFQSTPPELRDPEVKTALENCLLLIRAAQNRLTQELRKPIPAPSSSDTGAT